MMLSTAFPALVVALVLVVYPNVMAVLAARRQWDQWQAYTIGNTILAAALLLYALSCGVLPAAWGTPTPAGVLLGAEAGLIPLLVIVAAICAPGAFGRDIIASGIGDIDGRALLYRIGVQVALVTVCVEGFVFRGVLYALLARVASVSWTVVLDAVCFGLWHVVLQYNGFTAQRGLSRVATAAGASTAYGLLGLLLALVRASSGALLPALVAHGLLDIVMFGAMYLRRGPRPVAGVQ